MRFQIQWEPETLRNFADEWGQLDLLNQREAMDSLDDVDRLLSSTPMEIGESRGTFTKRILFHKPLTIVFRVDLRLQVVSILEARITKKRN